MYREFTRRHARRTVQFERFGGPEKNRQSTITLGLKREHMRIAPPERHQLVVAARLDDVPLFEDDDPLRHAHRRKTVGDDDRGAPFGQRAKAGEYGVLSFGVEGG